MIELEEEAVLSVLALRLGIGLAVYACQKVGEIISYLLHTVATDVKHDLALRVPAREIIFD